MTGGVLPLCPVGFSCLWAIMGAAPPLWCQVHMYIAQGEEGLVAGVGDVKDTGTRSG